MNIDYAIIVKNKTRLEMLVERFNTKAQAKFYIERSGADFSDYETEDRIFHDSLSSVQRQLSGIIKNKIVDRSFLPSFLFSNNQIVITLGQDGLVANTAKYVNDIPIIAINPDTSRYDGVLLPFNVNNFMPVIESVLHSKYKSKTVYFAEAKLNDGQRIIAFNDLFIGISNHTSARYRVSYSNKSEEQSSSGIIISTSTGCTGWLKSIIQMTYSMHNLIERTHNPSKMVKLQDSQLMFIVREAFPSNKTQTGIVGGIISPQWKLTVESLMPSDGVIFSDGIEKDFLQFNSGAIATIGIAPEKAKLVLQD